MFANERPGPVRGQAQALRELEEKHSADLARRNERVALPRAEATARRV